jgi:hypothetical protein
MIKCIEPVRKLRQRQCGRADNGYDQLRHGGVAADPASAPFQHFDIEANGTGRRPAFNGGVGRKRNGARRHRQASSAERRTQTAFINLIARCSDDRKSKHITKFRADMNATHSLIASLPLSCENRSAQSSRQLCRFYPINPYGVSGAHSALLATVAVRGN